MNNFTLSILEFVLFFTGCLGGRIEITTDYILDENWGEHMSRPMVIQKMKVKKDSTINPFPDISQAEILSKLKEDSLFRWLGNVNVSKSKEEIYRTKKIYFARDNGFTWEDEVTHRESAVFGNLEKQSWYKFSGLMPYAYFVYVYVDSTNQLHRFDVNQANY